MCIPLIYIYFETYFTYFFNKYYQHKFKIYIKKTAQIFPCRARVSNQYIIQLQKYTTVYSQMINYKLKFKPQRIKYPYSETQNSFNDFVSIVVCIIRFEILYLRVQSLCSYPSQHQRVQGVLQPMYITSLQKH